MRLSECSSEYDHHPKRLTRRRSTLRSNIDFSGRKTQKIFPRGSYRGQRKSPTTSTGRSKRGNTRFRKHFRRKHRKTRKPKPRPRARTIANPTMTVSRMKWQVRCAIRWSNPARRLRRKINVRRTTWNGQDFTKTSWITDNFNSSNVDVPRTYNVRSIIIHA